MREALRESLPALTKFYGLTPADVDEMTQREIVTYIDWIHEYRAEQERAGQ